MDKQEQEKNMNEIIAILQGLFPTSTKDKMDCKHGHSKINNMDKHGHCLTCVKDNAIKRKRKALGSGSIYY